MFAVVHLPKFPLQAALRHEPELWLQPVALVDPARTTPAVVELTDAARAQGVTAGLTPTQAIGRCRNVLIRRRAPAVEQSATEVLLQCAFCFSPNIEATAPGGCTLDLRGLTALMPSSPERTARWVTELRGVLATAGLRARIGIATTPGLALLAARWGTGLVIVDENDPQPFIAALPVAALEPSTDVTNILERWGVNTVGEFLALGQEALVERLGLEALALCAAASANHSRPLRLARPSEVLLESFEFDPPVETLEPLLFILRRFVDQLSPRLALQGRAAEALTLRLRQESGVAIERVLRVPRPTAEADILFRMLRTHLETLRTQSAIASVALEAASCPREQKQLGLFETALRDPQRFQETLARLAALLGADRVGTPVLEDSHRPDAFALVPPDFERAPAPVPAAIGGFLAAPRAGLPLRRLRPALKALVETAPENAGEQPLEIRCAMANGRLRITLGPWRASGRWWEPEGAWCREDWDVESAGGEALRLCRESSGWTVEGVLD